MTLPKSHRSQPHERCCGNCKFAHLVAYKLDLLCFHGDDIKLHGISSYPVAADHVSLRGDAVGMMEGDEYDRVWGTRVTDPDSICDEWEQASE
jgi:hypothetical protein